MSSWDTPLASVIIPQNSDSYWLRTWGADQGKITTDFWVRLIGTISGGQITGKVHPRRLRLDGQTRRTAGHRVRGTGGSVVRGIKWKDGDLLTLTEQSRKPI